MYCSAVTGDGLKPLLETIASLLSLEWKQTRLLLDGSQMALRGQLYDLSCVEHEDITEQGEFVLDIKLPLSDWKRLARKNQIDLEAMEQAKD